MIRCIIFSRDRAMQLDAALRSLYLHCHDVDMAKIWVLYKTTGIRHEKQYQELIQAYSGRVFFLREHDFRQELLMISNPYEKEKKINTIFRWLSALGKIGSPLGTQFDRVWRRTASRLIILLSELLINSKPNDHFVFFLVDDNIFVENFFLRDAIHALLQKEKTLGFSLRLGKNTTNYYSRKRKQSLPRFENSDNNITDFDWTVSDGNFGYPLEVSSSIYRLSDILPLLMGTSFDNPNVLEERMAFHARFFQKKRPWLTCYQQSVTFCNPINIVQSVMPNRSGEKIYFNSEELSSRFEQGERIKVEAYSGFIPESCHQEVELVFEKPGDEA